MRAFILFLAAVSLLGCDGKSQEGLQDRKFSIGTSQHLSPKDLGIEKYHFKCLPQKHEVAVFRSKKRSLTQPEQDLVYDQIAWTDGAEASLDLVIAPLSFYLGYPKAPSDKSEVQFRNSWNLRAGYYGYDIQDYAFIGSKSSSSGKESVMEIKYTKNMVTKTEDLVFEFEMFVMSLSEAKTLHPELEIEREPGTTSWKAAFMVREK